MHSKHVLFIVLLLSFRAFAFNDTPLKELENSFHHYHADAVAAHQAKLNALYPVITQDLLSMSLHLPNQEKSIRFKMDKKVYMLMADITHPPLTILDIILLDGFDEALTENTKKKLTEYKEVLMNSAQYLENSGDLNNEEKNLMRFIFNASLGYIDETIAKNSASKKQYKELMKNLALSIQRTLYIASHDLLTQFKLQLYRWRSQFPNENWHELRVVLLGFHQPRNDYGLTLFFQKLLKETDYERHVVYAEFQNIYPTKETHANDYALSLLAKSDYDQLIGNNMYNDPKALQYDVMGKTSKAILKDWHLDW